ncbi:MAG: L,D-transpeptidase [Actinomycetales bacterium]|nr:L,D-transpeptidase [Actinomycetales bacterium]
MAIPAAASSAGRTTSAGSIANVPYSVILEDQFLATLHYLPVSFVATVHKPSPVPTTTTTTVPPTTSTSTTTTTTTTPTTFSASTSTTVATSTTLKPATVIRRIARWPAALSQRSGRYVWRFPGLPAAFRSQWRLGTVNVILTGALMRFQDVHNMPVTGNMDTPTWLALLRAVLARQYNPTSYNVVYVQEALPQHLTLFQNGHSTFTTLVNTGIAVSPTEIGTHAVYLRYTSQTMSGTNPNGTHYSDPGIPWVSYFYGGDALHGFIRSSYGWPQSLGCVEMPFADAQTLWPQTPLGTMVTVQ